MNKEITEQLLQTYNTSAQEREQSKQPQWQQDIRAHFLGYLQQDGMQNLLELGAGTGRDGHYFQKHGLDVTCIDLSPEMVRLCQDKGLTAQVMDFMTLDFPAATFDAVYAFSSLLHVPKQDIRTVLSQIKSALKLNGLFFYGVYGGYEFEGIWEKDNLEPKRFYAYYTDEQLQALADEFFDVVEFQRIMLERPSKKFYYQALILRR